jgi:hypothetical protein
MEQGSVSVLNTTELQSPSVSDTGKDEELIALRVGVNGEAYSTASERINALQSDQYYSNVVTANLFNRTLVYSDKTIILNVGDYCTDISSKLSVLANGLITLVKLRELNPKTIVKSIILAALPLHG